MRKTLTTAALLLALSCPAFGGEMNTTGSPTTPPPPPPTSPVAGPTDDTTLNDETPAPDAPDTLTQFTLELLAFLPSLL